MEERQRRTRIRKLQKIRERNEPEYPPSSEEKNID